MKNARVKMYRKLIKRNVMLLNETKVGNQSSGYHGIETYDIQYS